MKNRNPLNLIWLIVAIILGVTLYKQFDFKTMTFEQPAMAVIYGLTFIAAVIFLIRGRSSR